MTTNPSLTADVDVDPSSSSSSKPRNQREEQQGVEELFLCASCRLSLKRHLFRKKDLVAVGLGTTTKRSTCIPKERSTNVNIVHTSLEIHVLCRKCTERNTAQRCQGKKSNTKNRKKQLSKPDTDNRSMDHHYPQQANNNSPNNHNDEGYDDGDLPWKSDSLQQHTQHQQQQPMTKTRRSSGSGAKRRPNNFGYCHYLDSLFGMKCFPNIVNLNVFTSAKDVSESMGCLQAVTRHGGLVQTKTSGDIVVPVNTNTKTTAMPNNDVDVLCLCIGDGSTPRTAVLASFLKKNWITISIDPNLKSEWIGFRDDVYDYFGYRGTLEEFVANIDDPFHTYIRPIQNQQKERRQRRPPAPKQREDSSNQSKPTCESSNINDHQPSS